MTFAALLLAGGLSRRMGRDKATLILGDQPLWARQLALLRQLRLKKIYISARETPAWAPADIKVLLDTPPSRGPLSGIALGLTTITTSHLLVLAVDLPRVTQPYLEKLTRFACEGKGVVPYKDGEAEPLIAIYPKEAVGLAVEALGSGDVSMRSFVSQLRTCNLVVEYNVTPAERTLHWNVNKPEDVVG